MQDHHMYKGAEHLVQHNDVFFNNIFFFFCFVLSTWGWAHNLTICYSHLICMLHG
jgi:hypothetical protein